MICPNCGTQSRERNRFCRVCGTEMPETLPLSSESPGLRPDDTAKEPESANAQRAKESDLVGQTLDQKYHIITKLGAGGMGSIYKARRVHIGDLVAIKVLHPELVGDQQAIERFRREAQAAARLKHINAVGIHDFAVSGGGLVYIAMELVEGTSLATIIKEQGHLAPSYVAEILSKVCSALDEAHSQNIVHRDLKPDNILVNPAKGEVGVKVLDFGIAKLRDLSPSINTLTDERMVVGTPQYMSPEQCMGEEVDGRSDIYSLGIVLYEMLTGVLPFQSPTLTAVIVQHVTVPPLPLRQINSQITHGVERAVMRALQKHKEERPQTAGELAKEFISGMKNATPAHYIVNGSGQTDFTPETKQAKAAAREKIKQADDRIAGPISGYGLGAQPAEYSIAEVERRNYRAMGILSVVVLALLLTAAWMLIRSRQAESSQQLNSNTPQEAAEDKLPDDAKRSVSPEPPGGMVYVTGGEFLMGRDDGGEYERPQHQAAVSPFFIDRFEVTCEEYKKFIDETGHRFPSEWSRGNYPSAWARRPVTGVDWDDVNAYAKWAGKRLPTEQEWEFAARGADSRLYPWGNEWKAKAANADTASHKHVDRVGVHSAGPSPFGAHDMAGNVWEWTASDLAAYPGGALPGQAPGEMKVIRGGSWRENRDKVTTAFRKGLPPRGGEYDNVGFRCVRDAIGSSNPR